MKKLERIKKLLEDNYNLKTKRVIYQIGKFQTEKNYMLCLVGVKFLIPI
jgi:hypothetical protein